MTVCVSLFISQRTVPVQAEAILQCACTSANAWAQAPCQFLVLLINPCLISERSTMKLIRAAILGEAGWCFT